MRFAAVVLCMSFAGAWSAPQHADAAAAPASPDVAKLQEAGPRAVRRFAVLKDVAAKYEALASSARDAAEHNRQAAAFLASVPGVVASGHDSGGAWARFGDGHVLVLDNSQRFASALAQPSTPDAASGPKRVQPRSPVARTSARFGLPSTTKACLYATQTVQREWLDGVERSLKKVNYEIVKDFTAEVDDLKKLPKDCGVFVLDAHATDSAWRATDLERHYSIQTNTELSPDTIEKYWDDFAANRLSYYQSAVDTGTVVKAAAGSREALAKVAADLNPNIAITDLGVKGWWTFPENAFVYMGICRGAAPVAGALRDAIIANNASVYAGWTGLFFGAAYTTSYVFDRLTGANVDGGLGELKEDPPQRAFPYHMLKADMEERGVHGAPDRKYNKDATHPDGWTELKFIEGPGDLGLLAPSVKYMTVDERDQTLTIEGWFGADPGPKNRKVEIGRSPAEPLEDCAWNATRIVCKLGEGQYGPVVVWNLDRPSNAVDLTQWKMKLAFSRSEDLEAVKTHSTVDATCVFRADVHEYREKPGETPKRREPFDVFAAKGSFAEWTMSSSGHVGALPANGAGAGTIRNVLHLGPRAGPKYPEDPSYLTCEGVLDPATGFEVSLTAQQKNGCVVGGNRADFFAIMLSLGHSQPPYPARSEAEQWESAERTLVRGSVVPIRFAADGSLRVEPFKLDKHVPMTSEDAAGVERQVGSDSQYLSCKGVTPNGRPSDDAAR